MSDSDPIPLRPRIAGEQQLSGRGAAQHGGVQGGQRLGLQSATHQPAVKQVVFSRVELMEILSLYGRMVAAGEWRDYAMDFGAQKAVFSVFRRATEFPLYTIEKNPQLARKQGAYSVVAPNGLILKRGPDLKRVLEVLDKKLRPVQ